MGLEEKIAETIKRKGISITAIAKATGIPYSALQPSLKGRRQLRAKEFFAVCEFLETDPAEFKPERENRPA